MHRRLPTAFVTVAFLALLGLASAQGVVNVYSARHYDSDTTLFGAFSEATGIEVNLIEAGADELIERILSEGANSPADVIITVDAGRLWRADDAGILAAGRIGGARPRSRPTCGIRTDTGSGSRSGSAASSTAQTASTRPSCRPTRRSHRRLA